MADFAPNRAELGIPGDWQHETSGALRPAVERYINRKTIAADIPIMRAYLRQWICADGFAGPEVDRLRVDVNGVVDLASLDAWIERALAEGIDPL